MESNTTATITSTSTTPTNMSCTMSTSIPNIEKLDGQSNYRSWKFAMRMSLMLEGLFGSCLDVEI
ncbi:hypothetical protein RN001_013297 [Aquatica leii]|uniref:Uncharacterized protein n=1 Tax=Aquatica leii TaxID=1421715 RepID=A0AAN7PRL1_9COLE|nr:hypothetical protein RN001_013297 [Aquatica leii]